MRRTAWPVLALLLAGPAAAVAQQPGGRTPSSLEAFLVGTTVREEAQAFAGGAALIGLGDRLSIGGAGALLLGRSVLPGATPGSDLELELGYGGAVAQFVVARTERASVAVRVLAGAGAGKVSLPVVGTEIAADNFGVVEPEVVGYVRIVGPFHLGASVGYRHAFGVEDLSGVAPVDLRGFSARASVAIRRF